MSKQRAVKIAFYFIGLVMPVLGMMNCKGFNEGSMTVRECFIDHSLLRSYADFFYGWMTISSFMLFIPIIIYIIIVIKLAKYISNRV